jgi:hypothetical protein
MIVGRVASIVLKLLLKFVDQPYDIDGDAVLAARHALGRILTRRHGRHVVGRVHLLRIEHDQARILGAAGALPHPVRSNSQIVASSPSSRYW